MRESESLRVNVPVGFLLTEPREIEISVDRSMNAPLSIRLRLIPAQPPDDSRTEPFLPICVRKRLPAWDDDDGYPLPEYGGGN